MEIVFYTIISKIVSNLKILKNNKNSLKAVILLLFKVFFYKMFEDPMSSLITSNTVWV